MNLLDNLRDAVEAPGEWREIADLQDYFGQFDDGDPEKQRAGQRIADLLDSYADRLERSNLVRMLSPSFTPQQLRVQAAEWRAGREPQS